MWKGVLNMQKVILLLVYFLSLGLLVGCGGGSSSSDDANTLLTGHFVGGPVAGLNFQTAKRSGQTNADGEFFYLNGETVSFYVGDILIGQAPGAATISPFDLAGQIPPTSGIDIRRVVNRVQAIKVATPFDTVINIAVFLQTLDEDGDTTNGIMIPAQVHTLATGLNLDFEQKPDRFKHDISLRKLMASGRAAGLWGGARAIANPYFALDHLYNGLGLTPSIETVSTEDVFRYDSEGNRTLDARLVYAYDANGNRILEEHDSDGDGKVDKSYISEYGENGNPKFYAYDSDGDGTEDMRTSFTYDANGNQILGTIDSDGDGVLDERHSYTYDESGNQTLYEFDRDDDGVLDWCIAWSYDENGNLTLAEYDDDGDGAMDWCVTPIYDANGNTIRDEHDYDIDGTVDTCELYAYDANGNRILHETDLGCDDMVDDRWTYAYDENGNRTLYETDYGADGMPEYRSVSAFDENGNRTLLQETEKVGSSEFCLKIQSTYDENGNLMLSKYDDGCDGTVESFRSYTYDANGNRTFVESSDGVTVNSCIEVEYTPINLWRASLFDNRMFKYFWGWNRFLN